MQAIAQHWQVVDIATVLIRCGGCIHIDTVADVGYECSTHAQHQESIKSGSDIVFGEGASANQGGGTGNIAILWIIALQQPLAKSAHPLHVQSWERNGADEDMEETLKYFAAFCGVCPQKFAEEIRAMSPAVKKRYEESSSKSWLQAWEEEADEREKEHPGGAVHESLYFVRGYYVGTGSLESRFFKGRQPNLARCMKEDSMNHRMRIHMNGPDVEEFCSRKLHGSETTYCASALCRMSQALYRKYFGSKTLQGRERRCKRRAKGGDEAAISEYRNKGEKRGLKVGHMAHHLREKWKQAVKTKTGKVSDMDKLVLQKLSETTLSAGLNEAQVEKRKQALDNQSTKKRFVEGMLRPVACAKMKERHDEEVKKQEGDRLKHQASLVSLAHNMMKKKWVAAEDCKVFSPRELKEGWWKDEEGDWLTKELTVVTKSVQSFCRTTPEKMKFWQVSTVGPFENGSWQADIVKKGLLMEDVGLLGAVLFGGYLVHKAWVEQSKPLLKKELLLEPLWKLRGSAVNKKLEVFFDPSVVPDGVISPTMSALFEAKPDRVWQLEVRKADDPSRIHQPAESSRWVWRESREEIRTKDAWVVCGGEKDAKELVEKKEAKEEKVKQLSEEIEELQEKLTTLAGKKYLWFLGKLVPLKGKLKEQEAKLKMLKGQPVVLKKFLEEVVLPGCVLCPP
jgi:hypothetical protein